MFVTASYFFLLNITYYSMTVVAVKVSIFRSQELLASSDKKSADFIKKLSEKPLTKCSPITCMTTLKKNSQDVNDVSCPVLATEMGNIYILDPQTFTVLHQVSQARYFFISGTAVFLFSHELKWKIVQKQIV